MIIKIGTDRFWVKASNIERWVEILNILPQTIPCKSKKDIAKKYIGYRVDDAGRIIKADEMYGLFGLEKSNGKFTIVGSNFIKENKSCYELTEGALKLIERYKNNENWESALAEQLLKYSIRVRSIAIALLNGGYLHFSKMYLENLISSYLNFNNKDYYIFSNKGEKTNINNLINDNSTLVLGRFWKEELKISDYEEIKFSGINNDSPSLSAMSTYLKIPVMLFNYLNWFKEEQEGKYVLDKYKMKEDISKKIYNSLIIEKTVDEIEILKELIKEYSDARELFPLEIVGSLLKSKIDFQNEVSEDAWIDRYIMTGIDKGKFKILDHEQGQPRHGRGLLGKNEYQLLKIDILK